MPVKRDYNWAAVRKCYETSDASLATVASEFDIPLGSVKARAAREGWKKTSRAGPKASKNVDNEASRNTSVTDASAPKPDMGQSKQKHDKPKCGGRTHQEDKHPCQRPAGWGTDHPGTGRCKLHGGCTPGAPKGNKNALTTGEYESILLDVLPEEDKEAWHRVNTEKIIQLDNEIRATEIRERRMLERIERLRKAEYTMVAYDEESTTVNVDAGSSLDAGVLSDRDVEENPDGQMDMPGVKIKRKYEGTLGQIQAIEEALTRVQAHKARLLKIKNEFEELELRRQESAMKNW